MRPFQLLFNFRGQALVETMLSLPTLVSGAILMFGGLHSLFAFYWVDYWTYQSALCLAQEQPRVFCRQQLNQRLQQVPFAKARIQNLSFSVHAAQVSTDLQTVFLRNREFTTQVHIPIRSRQFRGFDEQ